MVGPERLVELRILKKCIDQICTKFIRITLTKMLEYGILSKYFRVVNTACLFCLFVVCLVIF